MTVRSLASLFLDSLRELGQGRRRLTLEECWSALYEAEPTLLTAANKRRVLADLLTELAVGGALQFCAIGSFDRSELPAVPRFITLTVTESPGSPRTQPVAATFPWRPPLGWAAELDLTTDEFELLQIVNRFLRDGGKERRIVPAQERSLELLGHEKTLDRLSRGRLFVPGRLSWELLRARRVAPPFAWQRIGSNSSLLVAENSATFATLVEMTPTDSPIGFVAYGGGTSFIAAVESVHHLMTTAGLNEQPGDIYYFGDIDQRGIAIPLGANATAEVSGLPRVRPAVSLYHALLKHGRPQLVPSLNQEVAEELVAWFPNDLRPAVLAHLVSGHRLAQEAVGTDLLAGDSSWASKEALSGTTCNQSLQDET